MLIAMFCTNVISIAVCIFFSIQLYKSEKNGGKKGYVLYRIKETISDINEGAPSEEKKMVCKFLLNYINILEKTYL